MKLALAGDTMLGRGVAALLRDRPSARLVDPAVAEVVAEADVFVLNLECCISERGEPWPDPGKPFFFRAPPVAAERLAELGVACVSLANNHALDFGATGLLDTLGYLRSAGVASVGAGVDVEAARSPLVLDLGGLRLALVAAADHPPDYAASPARPGIAFADLRSGAPPDWLVAAIREPQADAVLVTPHWGPNLAPAPLPRVRRAAAELVEAGATLVAGHSAHVLQGVEGRVLYDLGDFLDDYAVDPVLRNDLGLLFLVTLGATGPTSVEAVPLKLDYCATRLADPRDARWIARRFRDACAGLGTAVVEVDGRLVAEPARP